MSAEGETATLTKGDVADMLQCSERTVERWTSEGVPDPLGSGMRIKLGYRQIGRLIRFRPEDVREFLDATLVRGLHDGLRSRVDRATKRLAGSR